MEPTFNPIMMPVGPSSRVENSVKTGETPMTVMFNRLAV